ncbi:MAG: chorismate synthase, partial [Xanthobacteraceae bacterium]
TAMRVAAGAIARKIVPGMRVRGALIQMGPHRIDRAHWDWDEVERNPFFCPDAEKAAFYADYLDGVRKRGSSVGAVLEIVAEGVPPGLGAPLYGKLDADLAAALMSINAVKGVEIGAGFGAAELSGEENGDEMRAGNDGKPVFSSNNAGGILGGISTGQPVVARFAVKPTSSIPTARLTVDRYGRETEIVTTGRHDPCVGIRAVPVGEAMVACVIADHYLRHRGQVGEGPAWPFPPPRRLSE